MIISASYRTDIPTFYGEWFMNRLQAGYCIVQNPYNRRPVRVDLRRPHVDGLVFWTKNIGPFLRHLPAVRRLGYPFIIQFTINGYPRALETSVVDDRRAISQLREIAAEYGPRVAVWRYDTIVVSTLTPMDFHRRNFERLASALRGATDEVVVSFAHMYRKTLQNLAHASQEAGFTWRDPSADEKRRLLGDLRQIAGGCGMQLTICSQPEYEIPGTTAARCVDAERLGDIAGAPIRARRKGNREGCACAESRDIGDYDTCPHGCVYCYAVRDRALALQRHRGHDPLSESLFPLPALEQSERARRTLPLFPDGGG